MSDTPRPTPLKGGSSPVLKSSSTRIGSLFTLDDYWALLGEFEARDYRSTSFANVDPSKRHLVLRHDVDFDIHAAIALAEREASRATAAVYFVRLRSEFYNPFSSHTQRAIRQLITLGHEVGLHFDPLLYPSESLVNAVIQECEILSKISDRSVDSFSIHRPEQRLIQSGLDVPGLRNTYAKAYFSDIGYCSDSQGSWNHGHPLDHPAVENGNALQLLTHPIWWTSENSKPQLKAENFLHNKLALLSDQFAADCRAFDQRQMGDSGGRR